VDQRKRPFVDDKEKSAKDSASAARRHAVDVAAVADVADVADDDTEGKERDSTPQSSEKKKHSQENLDVFTAGPRLKR